MCVCCHMLITRNRTGTDGTDGARCISITMRRNPSAGLRKTVLVTRCRPTGPFPLRSVSGKFGKPEVGKLGPGHDWWWPFAVRCPAQRHLAHGPSLAVPVCKHRLMKIDYFSLPFGRADEFWCCNISTRPRGMGSYCAHTHTLFDGMTLIFCSVLVTTVSWLGKARHILNGTTPSTNRCVSLPSISFIQSTQNSFNIINLPLFYCNATPSYPVEGNCIDATSSQPQVECASFICLFFPMFPFDTMTKTGRRWLQGSVKFEKCNWIWAVKWMGMCLRLLLLKDAAGGGGVGRCARWQIDRSEPHIDGVRVKGPAWYRDGRKLANWLKKVNR